MRLHHALLAAALLLVATSRAGQAVERTSGATAAPLVLDRGEGELPLVVPVDERLEFDVYLHLGSVLGDSKVGTVVLTGKVEPYTPPLPLPGQSPSAADGRVVGRLRSEAKGRYLNHSLDHVIDVRHLPQAYPRIFTKDTQDGSTFRRREQRIGTRGGESICEYRRDHHCHGCKRKEHFVESHLPWGDDHHCGDCDRKEHRVWKPAKTVEVPGNVVDSLSGVYIARTFINRGAEQADFPLVNKDDLWNVRVERGPRKVMKTPAGSFSTRKVELRTSAQEGAEEGDFEGLFGIHGDIRIYMDEAHGVPVVIEGDVPVGPFDLSVRVKLRKFSGTPEGFGPLPEDG